MGARSAGNPHAALRRGGGWKRGTAEILGHSQTKGRANRENKLRPKPARQSSTLPGRPFFVPSPGNQVRGARERGQGTEPLAKLGGLPPSVACVSQRLDA